MNSAIERLLGLRVSDIMNKNVVAVLETATIGEASMTLGEHKITGVPVVDSDGQCVGVLSVTDLAVPENLKGAATTSSVAPEERVQNHMSTDVQTIDASATILDAGRVLCREHIHRLVIVDEQRRPLGVMGPLDLVAAMVSAVEE